LPFAALWRYDGNVAEARSVAVPMAFRWRNGSRNAWKLLEMYEFRVLGSLDLRGPDGEKVLSVLAQPKRAALLAYLAVATPLGFHRRDKLIGLFWAERDQEHARAALRKALHQLRRSLGENVLASQGDDAVGLAEGAVWCDAVAFGEALGAGQPEEALDLYRGDLLEGFYIPEAPEFERWVDSERERLRGLASEAAWSLAEREEAEGTIVLAASWARKAVSYAPDDEGSFRRLLALLDRVGDRAGAIKEYEAFTRRLGDEYEAQPSPETQALIAAIREREAAIAGAVKAIERPAAELVPEQAPEAAEGTAQRASKRKRRWPVLTAAATALVLAGLTWYFVSGSSSDLVVWDRSIAVLPLENLSSDPEESYFADGIHGEIVSQLGKIADLRVISRTSVMEYKGRTSNVRDIAAELGVANILEGTVRRSGDRVRITLQLVAAERDEQLWSERYDRHLTDIFAIQADVARQVVSALQAALTPEELQRVASTPTENVRAYEYYLLGLEYWRRGLMEEDLLAAAEMFEQAVALDPGYAAAWARLSMVPVLLHWTFYRRFDYHGAREALDRAVHLEPNGLETRLAQGYYYYYGLREYDRALEEFRAALENHPSNAEVIALIGYLQRRKGEWEKSLTTLERALELDPRNAGTLTNQALSYYLLGRYQEAERYFDRSLALVPDQPFAIGRKAKLYLAWEGSTERAWRVLEQPGQRIGLVRLVQRGLDLVRIFPDEFGTAFNRMALGASGIDSVSYYLAKAELAVLQGDLASAQAFYDSARVVLEVRVRDSGTPEWMRWLGFANAGVGRNVEAVRQGRRALELEPVSKDAYSSTLDIETLAWTYVRVGEYDAAIEQLEHLLSIPSEVSSHLLRLDPIYDPLRDHPRFEALLQKHE
jgi:TolB-like protein/DNA-binding SARP family transcriptional activator/lipoprotein NlpI